jgi:hypothetical protein
MGGLVGRDRIRTWTAFLTRKEARINRTSAIFKPLSLFDKSGMQLARIEAIF